DHFLRDMLAASHPEVALPTAGEYATGLCFLPTGSTERRATKYRIAAIAAEEGLQVLAWREVPVHPEVLGDAAREAAPVIEQVFLSAAQQRSGASAMRSGLGAPSARAQHAHQLGVQAFRTRKRIERETGVYLPSLNNHTLVYKGMVTTLQLS